ncbi:hypothetical protein SAMN05428642_102340 [Flaviramulus basaltis]|uniref:PEGA domain-containing protein n=1 Tax=Flaviramulus basaltis TaxID=369401 RepID=A0A1K2IH96_9FLAO|nr:hypothetical protein [Flaviramulus basaltis]SFZ91801.1 hypothetical protein SAMN05428642_102340 [Flaviramulus basaltis]
MRNFGFYQDDKKIGTIANGKTIEYQLEPGKHRLSSKIDWCGSRTIEFDIKENETKTIELSGLKYGTLILPLLLTILLIYVFAKTQLNTNLRFLRVFGIILFFYPLYFLTFGKKNICE